ncbi:MAG: AAA family ATPase [Clostridiales bacterium]|nr:AAA family ATPase [Clostridiales bacterium]
MIIKRLSASFGRLKNDSLDLRDGLNIIEAPNESGKSTWCAFIKVMLYGIRTSDRDKQGYLSDKTRYRPWSGMPMEGAMDIEADGVMLTIERKSDGKLPMRDFTAVHTGTAEPYDGLHPDTAGETLLGVSEAVFERSAFISQAGIKVSQTPELEKRISSLVTTGDETSSYTEADERLRLWLRRRRFNKSGTIPALEEKLALINRKLAHIESFLDETASMRLEMEHLKKRQGEFIEEAAAWDRYDALLSLREAQKNVERTKAAYGEIHRELTKNGPAPTEADLSGIRGDLKALEPLKTMLSVEQQRLKDAEAHREKIFSTKKASVFEDTDGALAVQKASSLEEIIRKNSLRDFRAFIWLILAVIAALVAVFYTAVAPQLTAIRPAAAVVSVICAVSFLWRAIKHRAYRKELSGHLSLYHASSVAELEDLYKEDIRLAGELAEAEREVAAAGRSVSSASAMCDTIFENLRRKLNTVSPGAAPGNIEAALNRVEALLQKLTAAKAEIQAAESYAGVLQASSAAGGNEGGATAPGSSRQEISSSLAQLEAQLEDLTNRYNMALGEIRAIGDPVVLGSEKNGVETELAAQRAQYAALTLAIETLKDANDELQTRFSPLLSETAGRIIRRLTGGRYEKLTFDKTLDANAKTADETVSRNILSLSAGTADQIYLALRLAVCALVLPAENRCPLILDDALANFDDDRAALALDYLKELAGERQILLFTCHKREAAYFGASGDVNILRLK